MRLIYLKCNHLLRICLISALACLATLPVKADELRMANGDHITGTFIKHVDGKIFFKSAILGDIAIPDNQAEIVLAPVATTSTPASPSSAKNQVLATEPVATSGM